MDKNKHIWIKPTSFNWISFHVWLLVSNDAVIWMGSFLARQLISAFIDPKHTHNLRRVEEDSQIDIPRVKHHHHYWLGAGERWVVVCIRLKSIVNLTLNHIAYVCVPRNYWQKEKRHQREIYFMFDCMQISSSKTISVKYSKLLLNWWPVSFSIRFVL